MVSASACQLPTAAACLLHAVAMAARNSQFQAKTDSNNLLGVKKRRQPDEGTEKGASHEGLSD